MRRDGRHTAGCWKLESLNRFILRGSISDSTVDSLAGRPPPRWQSGLPRAAQPTVLGCSQPSADYNLESLESESCHHHVILLSRQLSVIGWGQAPRP